jgi:hypothetical protein
MDARETVKALVRKRLRDRHVLELSRVPAPGGGRCTAVIDLAYGWDYATGPEAVAGREWSDAALVQLWAEEYGLTLRTA